MTPTATSNTPWSIVKLGDVCEVKAGATHHPVQAEDGAYPVFGSGGYICQATEFRCPANTVTVGRKGTLDKPLLIEEPFWNIDTCFGVIPGEEIEPRYLWYFCQNFDFYHLVPSLGRPSTNSDAIKNIPIPLPPLEVQREIVAKVEKGLAEADALTAHFKRMATLADETFKAELDETFQSLSAPTVKLGDVCEFRRGLTYKKTDEVLDSSICVLRSNNVDLDSGELDLADVKCLRNDLMVTEEKFVFKDTILMCMANGSKAHLGKVAFIDKDEKFAFGGFMGLLVPNKIYPKYVYFSLRTRSFKDLIKSLQDGANINNLKFSDISAYPIPLPSLAEQQAIVTKLEAVKAKCERLKAEAERGVKAAEALRKAVLAEAFEQ